MRSSWPGRLLPVLQALAEGGWLAVVYAALEVAAGQQPRFGPLELAMLAGLGMAWARRRRWRSRVPEAVGLPLLALLGAAAGWFLDPTVRGLLVDGFPHAALGLHVPGWLGGIAVLRGGSHGSRDDDEAVQDRLLRYGIPGLALPWLVGTLVAPTYLRAPFTSVAFLSTMIFAASAFASLGLARLEAVRASTGGDWREGRSWLALMATVSIAMAAIGLPAAWLLGVPVAALATLAFGPLRLLLLAAILLTAPLFLLIAAATEALRPFLPRDLSLPHFSLPGIAGDPVTSTAPWATIVVIVVVLLLAAVELGFLGFMIYLRRQERLRMAAVAHDGFEERSIVIPVGQPPAATPLRRPRRRRDPSDPVDAYLVALDLLDRHARWRRHASETPAVHARRVLGDGLIDPAFARLTAAYELIRYGGRTLPVRELERSRQRLARLRHILRT